MQDPGHAVEDLGICSLCSNLWMVSYCPKRLKLGFGRPDETIPARCQRHANTLNFELDRLALA